jgi:hypothetical protein
MGEHHEKAWAATVEATGIDPLKTLEDIVALIAEVEQIAGEITILRRVDELPILSDPSDRPPP